MTLVRSRCARLGNARAQRLVEDLAAIWPKWSEREFTGSSRHPVIWPENRL